MEETIIFNNRFFEDSLVEPIAVTIKKENMDSVQIMHELQELSDQLKNYDTELCHSCRVNHVMEIYKELHPDLEYTIRPLPFVTMKPLY